MASSEPSGDDQSKEVTRVSSDADILLSEQTRQSSMQTLGPV